MRARAIGVGLLGLLALPPVATAQGWSLTFESGTEPPAVVPLSDGGVGVGWSPRSLTLSLLAGDGSVRAHRQHGAPLRCSNPSVDTWSDGDIMLTCGIHAWRLHADGSPAWQVRLTEASSDSFEGRAAADGATLLWGRSFGPTGLHEAMIVRLDRWGFVTWDVRLAGPEHLGLGEAVEMPDGGALAVGWRSSGGTRVGWIVRIDPSGAVAWERTIDGAQSDLAGVAGDGAGGAVACGALRDGLGNRDALVLGLDGSGDVTWSRAFGDEGHLSCQAIARASDGAWLLAGSRKDGVTSDDDGFLARVEATGVAWLVAHGGEGEDRLTSVAALLDGGAVLGGTRSVDAGSRRPWVVRTVADGGIGAPCDTVASLVPDEVAGVASLSPVASDVVASTVFVEDTLMAVEEVELGLRFDCTAVPCTPLDEPLQLTVARQPCPDAPRTALTDAELAWRGVDGAIGYEWEVRRACDGELLTWGTTAASWMTTARPWPPLPDGDISWRVRALARDDDPGTCDGAWSCGCDFTVITDGSCPDDAHEPDDGPWQAPVVLPSAAPTRHLHCDPDWVKVPVLAGATYVALTRDLRGGADTVLTLRDGSGAILAQDEDGGGGEASALRHVATETETLLLEVAEAGGAHGQALGYELRLDCTARCGPSWTRVLDRAPSSYAENVLSPTPEGGLLVLIDRILVELDPAGEVLRALEVGTARDRGRFRTVVADGRGGAFLAGSASYGDGISDHWALHLDAAWELDWEWAAGALGAESVAAIVPTPDGGCLLVGSTTTATSAGSSANGDVWLARLDEEGAPTWQRVLTGGHDAEAVAAMAAPGGGWFVAGQTARLVDSFPVEAAWVGRLGEDGTLSWQRDGLRDFSPTPAVTDAALLADGTLVAVMRDGAIALSPDGEARWSLAAPGWGGFGRTVAAGRSGLLLAGATVGIDRDVVVAGVTAQGEVLWRRRLETPENEGRTWAVAMPDGGFAVAAEAQREDGARLTRLLRLDPQGRLPACVAGEPFEEPYAWPPEDLQPGGLSEAPLERGLVSGAMPLEPASVAVLDACTDAFPFPPLEVSPPGSPEPLRVGAGGALAWERAGRNRADTFHVYRAPLSELRAGAPPSCLEADVPVPRHDDPEPPPPGDAWAYLVTARNVAGEGPSGTSSAGLSRGRPPTCR